MKILAIYNIKGGVGKTATTVNLAYLASRAGLRTLVWDLDPQGAATFYFRVAAEVRGGMKHLLQKRKHVTSSIRGTDFDLLDLLPADFSYRKLDLLLDRERKPKRQLERLIHPLRKSYDIAFLDCAPGISLVSEAVFRGAHALIVPTVPTPLSILTLHQIEDHLAKMDDEDRPQILPFASLVDVRKTLHRDLRDELQENEHALSTWIPYASVVEQMGVQRAPISTFAPSSLPACAYENLWEEIRERVGIRVRSAEGIAVSK